MYTCIRGIYIACPCFWDEPERAHLLHSMAGSAMKVGGRSSRWLCSQALIQYIIAVCLLRFCTQWCAYCCHAWTKWLRTKIAAISLQSASTDYISNKTKASVQPCPTINDLSCKIGNTSDYYSLQICAYGLSTKGEQCSSST